MEKYCWIHFSLYKEKTKKRWVQPELECWNSRFKAVLAAILPLLLRLIVGKRNPFHPQGACSTMEEHLSTGRTSPQSTQSAMRVVGRAAFHMEMKILSLSENTQRTMWGMLDLRQRSSVAQNTEKIGNGILTATNCLCRCLAYGPERPFDMSKFS